MSALLAPPAPPSQTAKAEPGDDPAGPSVAANDSSRSSFTIADTSQYSSSFLRSLRAKQGYIGRHITLRGDSILVESDPLEEAIVLPTDLPLGVAIHYGAQRNGRQYRLALERRNISTVHFHYTVRQDRVTLFERAGSADLYPLFYLGAEGVFEVDGVAYGMNKYYPSDTDGPDYLLIGAGNIDHVSYIHISTNAKDSVLSMDLDKR